MILLANRLLTSLSELNRRTILILSLFQGSEAWLNWMLLDPNSTPLQAANEDQLLKIVIGGLHTDSYARFNAFRVHLRKLLEMPEDDLRQLVALQNAQNNTAEAAELMASRNALVTYNEITDALKFFEGITDPLFKYPSFEDSLALALFFKQLAPDEKQQKQGFDFALAHADSIPSFIDLFWFYTLVCAQQPPSGSGGTNNLTVCENMYQHLLPLSYHLLFTPNAGNDPDAANAQAAISQLAMNSMFIGYDTTASAMHNLVRNIVFNFDDNEYVWQSMIEAYLLAVKSIVATQFSSAGTTSQDGNLITYSITTDSGNVLLGIDETGNLILLPQTRLTLNQKAS